MSNITVNENNIWWVEYHFSHAHITIVMYEMQSWWMKIVFLSSFMSPLCHVRNEITYVHSWWPVSALTSVLFCCLGNKHQNNPLMSPETVRHSSPYIIIPPETKFRGYILDSPCSSVRLSVCLSVRPSVRPWVGVRMITLILFSGFKKFFLHISLGSRSCTGLNISVLPH